MFSDGFLALTFQVTTATLLKGHIRYLDVACILTPHIPQLLVNKVLDKVNGRHAAPERKYPSLDQMGCKFTLRPLTYPRGYAYQNSAPGRRMKQLEFQHSQHSQSRGAMSLPAKESPARRSFSAFPPLPLAMDIGTQQ